MVETWNVRARNKNSALNKFKTERIKYKRITTVKWLKGTGFSKYGLKKYQIRYRR
jgi:hypothetical protein